MRGRAEGARRLTRADASIYAVLTMASLFALAPLLWALSTSLKVRTQIFAAPPVWWPRPVTFENYAQVLFGSPMPRYVVNTLVVAVLSILLVLVAASHTAYATARLRMRGREVLAFAILATSMVPIISLLTPLYAMWARLGLHDTYVGLALVYAAWQLPATIWFIRGFVEAVPRSLEEAAMLDGCSQWQCFYRIILPIIQPGLVAAAILVFIAVWNDFLLATTLTISEERRLVQVGFYHYIGDTGVEWGRFMAFAMVAVLPILVMFVALRNRLLRGLVSGAMKG